MKARLTHKSFQTCAIENYMEKSPRYSLAMRYNPPKDRVGKPGPGAYMSEHDQVRGTFKSEHKIMVMAVRSPFSASSIADLN